MEGRGEGKGRVSRGSRLGRLGVWYSVDVSLIYISYSNSVLTALTALSCKLEGFQCQPRKIVPLREQ